MDLVERQTGHRPSWLESWDESAPAWDAHGTLGVDLAIEAALRNNRELRADLETIGQAHADLVQAGLLQNPTLNFMIMFPDGGGRSMLRSAGFPLQQLQDLWLIPVREEAAAARLQQTILGVADRAVQTAADVKSLYARIQYAQRAIELIRANLDIAEQTRRLIQIRQAAGHATLVEVNLVRIRYLRLQSDLLGLEAQRDALQRELAAMMGYPDAGGGWTVAALHEIDEPVDLPPSEEDVVSVADRQRLDLQAMQWGLAAAQRDIDLMRREGWPDLSLGLGFERSPAPRSQGSAGEALADGTFGRADERVVDWTIGPMIDVELPIFDWNQARVARAVHEWRQRRAEYDAARQRVNSQVRQTCVMVRQACQQVRFFREAILPEVQSNIELVRESYRAGGEEVTVLLQVQEDLIATRLTALGFVRDWLLSRAALERDAGGSLVLGAVAGMAPQSAAPAVE